MAMFMLGFVCNYAFLATIYIIINQKSNNNGNYTPQRWRD
jgi:hypothetical protein